MNDLLTPEQRDAIRKRATYNPPLDESAYEGSGFEQAIGDVTALLRDREAIAERLEAMAVSKEENRAYYAARGDNRMETIYHGQWIELRALVTAIRGEK